MGYPRKRLVDEHAPGIYHCTSRCVRQAWLIDSRSTHRKTWIVERMAALAELFAVAIDGFAVMSNHYHLQIYVDPRAPAKWDDLDVARRWVSLYPRKTDTDTSVEQRVQALVDDIDTLAKCRRRLGSLSEFMAHLNSYIARRANREDDCKGRFWEGRFRCQAVLDATARLRSMAYIDLNPWRAGRVRDDPQRSEHTSASVRARSQALDEGIRAVVGSVDPPEYGISLFDYQALLLWTAGRTDARPQALAHDPVQSSGRDEWRLRLGRTESAHPRALGAVDALRRKADELGQKWLWGVGAAR